MKALEEKPYSQEIGSQEGKCDWLSYIGYGSLGCKRMIENICNHSSTVVILYSLLEDSFIIRVHGMTFWT